MKYTDKNVTPEDFDAEWRQRGILIDERVEDIRSLCPEVSSAIDLGGGSGGLTKLINATLVDWSPVGCEIARAQGLKAICQNLLDFFKEHDEKYELVVLADVLEEMKMSETLDLLDGVKKICSKYFVISTPTHENYLGVSTHQVIYTKSELEKMITERGFRREAEVFYADRLIARYVCQ